MKGSVFLIPLLLLLFAGVFGAETGGVKMMSVMEGDSVILSMCANSIQRDSRILWTFGAENSLLAKINKASQMVSTYDDVLDGRFRNRLQVDEQTGSLTIRNIRTNHSGLYTADMISSKAGTFKNVFNVTVIGVFDPELDKLRTVSVKEGDSVTLHTDVTVRRDDLILWKFGRFTKYCVYNALHHIPCHSDVTAVAKLDGETREISLDDGEGEMFTHRLRLDQRTGDLSIRGVRTQHAGFYLLQISRNNETRFRKFHVTVSAGVSGSEQQSSVCLFISIFLLLVVVIGGLTAAVINYRNRNIVFRTMMSWACCQSNTDGEVETVSVNEGESVTLHTDTEPQTADLILWRFEGNIIAKVNRTANKTSLFGRFRDRLQVDDQTGSLTITNIRTEQSGDYKLKTISNRVTSYKKFNVSVGGSTQRQNETESLNSPLMTDTHNSFSLESVSHQ